MSPLDLLNKLGAGDPWHAFGWGGAVKVMTPEGWQAVGEAGLPAWVEVAEVVAFDVKEAGWDGDEAVLLRLRDGRYLGWESWWGPTGNGFERDAYGGDAAVWISADLDDVLYAGLGAAARRMLGYPEHRPEAAP